MTVWAVCCLLKLSSSPPSRRSLPAFFACLPAGLCKNSSADFHSAWQWSRAWAKGESFFGADGLQRMEGWSCKLTSITNRTKNRWLQTKPFVTMVIDYIKLIDKLEKNIDTSECFVGSLIILWDNISWRFLHPILWRLTVHVWGEYAIFIHPHTYKRPKSVWQHDHQFVKWKYNRLHYSTVLYGRHYLDWVQVQTALSTHHTAHFEISCWKTEGTMNGSRLYNSKVYSMTPSQSISSNSKGTQVVLLQPCWR